MTLDQIKQNVRNTIAGKEAFHSELVKSIEQAVPVGEGLGTACATQAICAMVELNLIELRAILADLERCSDIG